jgi:aerobic carbon-monoxide dehydrogenase small subunit
VKDVHSARLTVNGRTHQLEIESRRTLADVLRHDLGYTGTHLGCEHGICGACTVLLDGLPVRACLIFGVQADGCEIETVEGIESDGRLNSLQVAFSAHHGLQCGFCTPGFLMLATAFLRENADPTEEEIREAMSSNLCRCTGYQGIIEAVGASADQGQQPEAAVDEAVATGATEDRRVEGVSPLRDVWGHDQ